MDAPTAPLNPLANDGALALSQLFFLPGDWAIYLLARYLPAFAALLGFEPDAYGSAVSACLSLVGWCVVAIALISSVGAVRDFDRYLTGKLGALYVEARRHIRMALVRVRYRRGKTQVREETVVEVTEDLDLSRDELRVLQVHAAVAPGYALAVTDIAHELKARGYQLHGALERLVRLALLQSTVGGIDGETAYTLTPMGRAVLRARSRRRD